MNRLFLDMDGVIVEEREGPYTQRPAVGGAFDAIAELKTIGLDLWIATKPIDASLDSVAMKQLWVSLHLPDMRNRIIVTPDKSLLGDEGDYLVDNRPEKCNCEKFLGALIKFESWEQVMRIFRHAEVSDATA